MSGKCCFSWYEIGVVCVDFVLPHHGPENIILAVSKELRVDEEEVAELPVELYVFRSVPVAREVLSLLEKREGQGTRDKGRGTRDKGQGKRKERDKGQGGKKMTHDE